MKLTHAISNSIELLYKMKGEFFLTAGGNLLYLSQTVIQTKIFSTLFSTEAYGKWALLISVYTLVSMLPFSAFNQGVYRIAYKCRENKEEGQLYSCIIFSHFGLFLFYSLLFLGLHQIQGDKYFAHDYSIIFCAYTFSEILKNAWVTIDNSYRKRKHVFKLRVIDLLSRLLLFYVLYYYKQFDIRNVLIVLIITNGFILLIQRDYFRKLTFQINNQTFKNITKEIVLFSMPLLIWAVFSWMQNMISRWYLDEFMDIKAVANYAILTAMASFFPNIFYGIINSFVMPIVYAKQQKISRTLLLKFLGGILAVLLVYLVFVVFGGRYIITIFSDSKYIEVVNYLPLMTLTTIVYVTAQLSTVEVFRLGQTKRLLIPSILPGLFMATVGYFLIMKYSFEGAVANFILGQLIYSILTFSVVFKKQK